MTQRELPVLVFQEGERAGQRWTLQTETLLIGRGNECDLVLPEKQVSREHIKIKLIDEQYYVEDLESKNGTWVNGQPLKGERLLKDGDEIHIALVVKISFVESEATAPISFNDMLPATGGLRLDRGSRRVFIGDREINPPLSLPQYRLLELLLDAQGGICTRENVIEAVWPQVISEGVSEQAIDALVRRLRDRIAQIDPAHEYIVTVRGHGFRLDNS
ncbi:MAG: FHA domain-containing protein [Chloroflexota bacterium]